MSFGRKGLAPGQAAPAAPGGFGRAGEAAQAAPLSHSQIAEIDDIAAKREAFIASERARRSDEIGEGGLPDGGDPLASLRNTSRPAQPARPLTSGPIGASGLPQAQEEQIRAAARGMSTGAPSSPQGYPGYARSAPKSYFFGDPNGRSLGIAYLIWFVIGQTGLHRAYCGSKDTAIMQVGLLVGSFVTLFIFPPIGMVGFGCWFIWIIADLFLMPGMMRRFKEQHNLAHRFE